MIRSQFITTFRAENPEITEKVIPDSTLISWCKEGNRNVCALTRCIVEETSFATVAEEDHWDLSAKISKFFDINEYPGGGVVFDGERLTKTTKAELDEEEPGWRSNSSGTPEKYFRYGKYIYTEKPVSSALTMIIDAVLIPDSWDTDIEPFNQLSYLEPYHYSIILYLQKKAKMKVGKPGEEAKAEKEYSAYVAWMKNDLMGGKASPIRYKPPKGMTSTNRYRR